MTDRRTRVAVAELSVNQGIEAYLAEVSTRLSGPSRTRSDIVAELRGGLLDATDAYRSAGLLAAEALAAATAEFGEPRTIAAAFGPELGLARARRTALVLIATGPLIGLLWAAAVLTSRIGAGGGPPWTWGGLPMGSRLAVPAVAFAVVLSVVAALMVVTTTGRLTRWVGPKAHLAPAVATVASFGATAADAIILVLLAIQLTISPATLSPWPVAAAAMASLIRFSLAGNAGRRCLAASATLN